MDEEESVWWAKYGKSIYGWEPNADLLEESRGYHVREIIKRLPPDAAVLDLGCGTGWLPLLLAKHGAKRVVGLDFSEEQLARARADLAASGLSERVQFANLTVKDFLARNPSKFDVVICHGFLHHLTWNEIEQVLNSAKEALRPEGTLWLFEPIESRPRRGKVYRKLCYAYLGCLDLVSRVLGRSARETELRQAILESTQGFRHPGHGISPKEMPFQEGELNALLERHHFELFQLKPSMCFAYMVVTKLNLIALSHPLMFKLLKWPVIWIARRLEWWGLWRLPNAGWKGWILSLCGCTYKPKAQP